MLDGFQLGSSFCREYHIYEGTTNYLKEPILTIGTRLDLDFICSEFNFEVAGFCLAKLKLVIVALYRSPGGDPNMFLKRLDDLLNFFCKPQWKTFNIVIGGDVNSAFYVTREKKPKCN